MTEFVGDVAHETERWIVRALGLLRIAQVVPWLGVIAASGWEAYRSPALVIALYCAYLGWAVVFFRTAIRANGPGRGWVHADVAASVVVAVAVGLACEPGRAGTWHNWTLGPVMGASVVAVLYGRGRERYVIPLVLMAAYGAPLRGDLGTAAGANAVLSSAVAIAAYTLAAAFVAGRLRATAVASDRATAEAVAARGEQTRLEERVRQHDMLHTNVLATLTIIARGDGVLTDQLRARCDRDAKYLRAVVQFGAEAQQDDFKKALANTLLDQGALGLDIHYSVDQLPHQLAPDVTAAVIHAVREALNNVLKHGGVNEAWVTAVGERGGVRITVTDRGVGFDPPTVQRGLGLSQAIEVRMAAVGGRAEITSLSGHGTSVELTWNK